MKDMGEGSRRTMIDAAASCLQSHEDAPGKGQPDGNPRAKSGGKRDQMKVDLCRQSGHAGEAAGVLEGLEVQMPVDVSGVQQKQVWKTCSPRRTRETINAPSRRRSNMTTSPNQVPVAIPAAVPRSRTEALIQQAMPMRRIDS
jgi:hypothetical protein